MRVRSVLRHLARHLGPRADDAHVAAHHRPELRQLVEGVLAEHSAEARHPGVVLDLEQQRRAAGAGDHLVDLGFGVQAHGAELVDGERLAAQAHALLPEEDRAAVVELDRQRHREQHRGQQGQRQQRERDVESPLHDVVPPAVAREFDVQQPDAFDLPDADPGAGDIGELRHEQQFDRRVLQAPRQPPDRVARQTARHRDRADRSLVHQVP